jgi:hypothetical protein
MQEVLGWVILVEYLPLIVAGYRPSLANLMILPDVVFA